MTIIPHDYIEANTTPLIQVLLFSFILIVFITIISTLIISQTVTRPVAILSRVVKQFHISGDKKELGALAVLTDKDPGKRDELADLAADFSEMQERLDTSFSQILDLSVQKEKMKYQLLQSKINPHFLYNMLESIKAAQMSGHIPIANQMISTLALFYRKLLRASDDLITIKEELDIAELYLGIEKLCRGKQLSWHTDYEDGIENFMICKFTLQPIIENCLAHGSTPSAAPLHISITISYGEDSVIMAIRDNGIGMAPSQLEKIRSRITSVPWENTQHYGLRNVHERLNLYSAGKARISIGSIEYPLAGHGTVVTVEFPQIFMEI